MLTEIFEDRSLQTSLVLYPERRYMLNSTGDGLMRVWDDFHTGKDWWTIQVRTFIG